MKLEDMIAHLDGGKNPSYRRIKNNTFVVKTTELNGFEYYGIQLHRTVVFAHLPGHVYINDGGWATPTTRDRINSALSAVGLPAQLHQNKRKQYITVNREWDSSQEFTGATVLNYEGEMLGSLDYRFFPLDVPLRRVGYYAV